MMNILKRKRMTEAMYAPSFLNVDTSVSRKSELQAKLELFGTR
jgi:hypothetical protein